MKRKQNDYYESSLKNDNTPRNEGIRTETNSKRSNTSTPFDKDDLLLDSSFFRKHDQMLSEVFSKTKENEIKLKVSSFASLLKAAAGTVRISKF